ncbi:hypothetical protein RQP46_009253 [Phenoliferia psychrophenolica]
MVFKLVAKTPTLAPLMVYVAVGTTGAVAFATRYLYTHIGVTGSPDPWNQVTQGHNSKLFSWNQAWWQERQHIPDPRSMFQEDIGSTSTSSAIKVAKAKAIRAAKAAKTANTVAKA